MNIPSHMLHPQQAELQETTAHLGVYNDVNERILALLTRMLNMPWQGKHTCGNDDSLAVCDMCSLSAQWFSLASKVGGLFQLACL